MESNISNIIMSFNEVICSSIFQDNTENKDTTTNNLEEENTEPAPEDSPEEENDEGNQATATTEDITTVEPLSIDENSSEKLDISKYNPTNNTKEGSSLSDEVVMVLQEKTGWVCNGSVCTDLGPIYDRQTPSDGNSKFLTTKFKR